MMDEQNLFDTETMEVPEELKALSNRNGTLASKQAAEDILPQLKGIKKEIVDLLELYPQGLTIFQISEITGIKLQTVSGRPSELIKANRIFEAGTVEQASGKNATVYRHIKFKSK